MRDQPAVAIHGPTPGGGDVLNTCEHFLTALSFTQLRATLFCVEV